ncbi:Sister chromatid cohesion 1 protein 1 [Melia azedarach]|uniref:Sister chromatid cohesion 1 protein 1 n=1 Tax=Melia azedarach TaxID=155640 RepID=A0ACC1YXS3_MELAZ|nr:Sister chromatid cohesion 1 protein 1 [Melia azedarach]
MFLGGTVEVYKRKVEALYAESPKQVRDNVGQTVGKIHSKRPKVQDGRENGRDTEQQILEEEQTAEDGRENGRDTEQQILEEEQAAEEFNEQILEEEQAAEEFNEQISEEEQTAEFFTDQIQEYQQTAEEFNDQIPKYQQQLSSMTRFQDINTGICKSCTVLNGSSKGKKKGKKRLGKLNERQKFLFSKKVLAANAIYTPYTLLDISTQIKEVTQLCLNALSANISPELSERQLSPPMPSFSQDNEPACASPPQMRSLSQDNEPAYASAPQMRSLSQDNEPAYASAPQMRSLSQDNEPAYASPPQMASLSQDKEPAYASPPQMASLSQDNKPASVAPLQTPKLSSLFSQADAQNPAACISPSGSSGPLSSPSPFEGFLSADISDLTVKEMIKKFHGWLKYRFQDTRATEKESLNRLISGCGRGKTATIFHIVSVFASKHLICVEQREPCGDIIISRGPKLYEVDVEDWLLSEL